MSRLMCDTPTPVDCDMGRFGQPELTSSVPSLTGQRSGRTDRQQLWSPHRRASC